MTDTNSTTRICSIEGCEKRVLARGWCPMHYSRWQRNGEPEIAGAWAVAASPQDAFDMRTEWDENGCLVWTGALTGAGYGHLKFSGKMLAAHRLAWTLVNGEIPDGMWVNHKCWNPACVNVEHLNLATNAENMAYRPGPNANNTSGYRNVYWSKGRQCWYVRVVRKGKVRAKYGFSTPEEASEYAEWLREHLNGEFAGKG